MTRTTTRTRLLVAAVAVLLVLLAAASTSTTTATWRDPARFGATASAGTWGPVLGCTVHHKSDGSPVRGASCEVDTPVPSFYGPDNGGANLRLRIDPGATDIMTVYARATFRFTDPAPGFDWTGVVVTGQPGTWVTSSCALMPTLTIDVTGNGGREQSVYLPLARVGCAG